MTTRLTCLTLLLALVGFGCSDDYGTGTPPASADSYDSYGGGGYGEGTPAPPPVTTPPPVANADCVGAPVYEDVAAFDKCVMCHDSMKAAAQRKSAPININFDTQAAAESHAMQAVNIVKAGVMPPIPSGLTLTEVEKQQLYTWAMCSM